MMDLGNILVFSDRPMKLQRPVVLTLSKKAFANIVEKGGNAYIQHFLLFP